jgi:hypothetical protein
LHGSIVPEICGVGYSCSYAKGVGDNQWGYAPSGKSGSRRGSFPHKNASAGRASMSATISGKESVINVLS